ncbi:MAG: DUF1592 domain-containing protein [Bryobacterales bacterium]|nr:DUF1592 domain-containing protein [Bryobacterales bacterium]
MDFGTGLWPVLERAQCRQCHSDNGVGSTTRLQFPEEAAGGGAPEAAVIAEFGRSLRRFVTAGQVEESLLWKKPTGRMPHGGGERIRKGTADETALRAYVEYLAKQPEYVVKVGSGAGGGSRPVMRRLTHSQYNHTVRDLLGEETRPADQFPNEDFVNGFTNQADGQSVSPLLAEAYSRAAERLARGAFAKGDTRKLLPCAAAEAGCAARFIREFGRRAFRRPLTEAETAKYGRLFAREPEFLKGAQIVVETMLQSPHFLFHLEPGAYGVASRLSYFLWDTMPDEALLAAAGSGELATRAGIEKQVRRMLAVKEKAQPAFDEFLAQWLRFDRLRGALRDRQRFPEFSPELVGLMIEETTRLFRELAWGGGNFMEFFSAPYSYLVPELARLYGVDAPQEPWAKTAFPAGFPRAGIVGQAAFLTVTSKPADTSPTERGLFIREHFLCQQVPPPPAGVSTTLPPVTDEKPVTQRQRLGVHLSNQVCAGCHTLVDPIGYGFENFDAIGKFREKELIVIAPTFDEVKTKRKVKPTEYLLDINPQGTVRGLADSDFSNPAGLGRRLAVEPNCQKCVVKQVFRYAVGRHERAEDNAVIDAALERFRRSQFQFGELIMALASSEAFRGEGKN